MANNDDIPIDGVHRGVGLHAGQSEARLRTVRDDIDDVHSISDLDALVRFADDVGRAPEARIYARAKGLAIFDEAVDRRAVRSRSSALSRDRVRASAAGCGSLQWRSKTHFCSLLDPGPAPGNDRRVRREVPLESR